MVSNSSAKVQIILLKNKRPLKEVISKQMVETAKFIWRIAL
jgi:hypothetical protein